MIPPIKWHMALVGRCARVWAVSNALKRPVVATFSILGDVVEQVGRDTINVDSLEVVGS
jgi:ABC-type Zn uptake system ZnuABC Zn-binding protein ZnuA